MEENKVTQIDEGRSFITKPSALTNDDIQHEYDYYQAQKILEDMRNHSLISDDEFNKITALNRENSVLISQDYAEYNLINIE